MHNNGGSLQTNTSAEAVGTTAAETEVEKKHIIKKVIIRVTLLINLLLPHTQRQKPITRFFIRKLGLSRDRKLS